MTSAGSSSSHNDSVPDADIVNTRTLPIDHQTSHLQVNHRSRTGRNDPGSDRPECDPDRQATQRRRECPDATTPAGAAPPAKPNTAADSNVAPPRSSSPALTSQHSHAKRSPISPVSPDHALEHLSEALMDLPSIDLSLLVTLPKPIGPDLQRLRESIELDDADWGWDALTAVARQIDTPQQRAKLADNLITLRDQHRINRRQAAAAILDLDSHSTRFIAASLLEAIALSVGASQTPNGLQIAA